MSDKYECHVCGDEYDEEDFGSLIFHYPTKPWESGVICHSCLKKRDADDLWEDYDCYLCGRPCPIDKYKLLEFLYEHGRLGDTK